MLLSDGYLKLMAQKIIKLQLDWDNKNKYTSLFLIMAPIFTPEQRLQFNRKLKEFSLENYGLRHETAERIIYNSYNPFMAGQDITIVKKERRFNDFSDTTKQKVDVVRLEKGLRNIAVWCLIVFKEVCANQNLKFENDDVGIPDFREGVSQIL